MNRKLRGIEIPDCRELTDGVEVFSGNKAVGTLTSVAPSADGSGSIALSLLRHEVANGDEVQIHWNGQSIPAWARALPLDPTP